MVSPSVAYIDTAKSGGSGILLDDGMILTNAHVVWPYDEARVIFPDGTEFENVPVANRDLLADLAVLGPVETGVQPVELITLEELDIGSDVYLIGYPGEVEAHPQPSITRGLISRVREWEPLDVTYYQTDATIGGGQSGGMLVTEFGEVIGISSYLFSDAGFGLVASASDILPRVERLLAGENMDGLKERGVPATGGEFSHSPLSIDYEWDAETFVINERVGTEVSITAGGGRNDVGILVLDVFGNVIAASDQTFEGEENITFEPVLEAPYFVQVRNHSRNPLDAISIDSTSRLIPLVDLDDGKAMKEGKSVYGNIDFAGDLDYFMMPLDEGDKIYVQARSISIDPLVLISHVGASEEQVVGDDDGGGGMFGLDAEVGFIASDSGMHLLIVTDSTGYGSGAYALEVHEPYIGAPTPMVFQPTPEPVVTDLGDMAVYNSLFGNLAFLYPSDWTRAQASQSWWYVLCEVATDCFASENALLAIMEEDLSGFPEEMMDSYIDLAQSSIEASDGILLSVEEVKTDGGITGTVITSEFSGLYEAKRLIVLHENMAFNVTYLTETGSVAAIWPVAEFSFSSLEKFE